MRLGRDRAVQPAGERFDQQIGAEAGQAVAQRSGGVVRADGGAPLGQDGATIHAGVEEHDATPVSGSPARMAAGMGVGPRQRGSSEGCDVDAAMRGHFQHGTAQ